MMRWIGLGIVVALSAFAVAGAACSSSSNKTSATKTPATRTPAATSIYATPLGGTAASETETPSASAATVIVTQNTSLAKAILTDAAGKTLYTYANDSAGVSNCTAACASAWPPLTATGTPTAGAGVTGSLGTIQRSDGTTQVTYNGSPLYYFSGDSSPGDATGNGVNNFSVVSVAGG